MDKLKQCVVIYDDLLNKNFFITLENNKSFRFFFDKKYFKHLLGLHKLKDKTLSNYPSRVIYDNIIDGDITYDIIKESRHFNRIKNRIDNFHHIKDMLFDRVVVNFDSSKTYHTYIKSDIIFFKKKSNFYLHLCLAQDKQKYYYPETFLVHHNDYYIKNQNILKIKELKIVDVRSKKTIQHLQYLKDFDMAKEYTAATIDFIKRKDDIVAIKKDDDILVKLENGIKQAMNSENFKAFLKIQSQFHSYSANNAMLIWQQKPDATRVAGYKTWQKLGRQVMKGEKGISILAPCPYSYEKLVDKIDPKTKEPIKDPETGEVVKEKIKVQGLRFKKVTVFDISQTTGKELPSICNELQGNSVGAEKIIKAIKQISQVPIIEKHIESGAKGYYSPDENLIVIKQDMSLDQTAKTLIHEYAHSQLHSTEKDSFLDKATKEVQAESVAYIVSDHFGVDTSEYSFEYIASWSIDKELSELKKSLNIIQRTADNIIQAMEKVIIKELELQTKQEQLEKQYDAETSGKIQSVKDKIVEIYTKEFPAIKYISDSTAELINNINQTQGKILSIKELKQAYKQAGKNLEYSNSINDKNTFNTLEKIVNDCKQAQLKHMQLKSHHKTMQNQLNASKTMEIVQ